MNQDLPAMAPQKDLSRQRRNCKGSMTRAINLWRLALDNSDTSPGTVNDLFQKVNTAFDAVEKAHHSFTDGIEDDDEYEKEEQWMEAVQATFLEVRLQTESFLRGKKACPTSKYEGVVPDKATTAGNSNKDVPDEATASGKGDKDGVHVIPGGGTPPLSEKVISNANVLGNEASASSGMASSGMASSGMASSGMASSGTVSSTSNRLSDFNEIKLALELPKTEYAKFNGDPIEFFSFMVNFETNIERKVSCNPTRLQHLKTMCQGKARSYIECCDLLGDAGYDEAKRILRTQFGQPYMILNSLMRELTNRRPIRSNDADSLWDLIASMKKCYVTLTKLGYTNDLNSTSNLLKVQDLLPNNLQTAWVKKAHDILTNSNREPEFRDLLDFLVKNAEVSSTMFGMNMAKSRNAMDRNGQRPVHVKSNHINTKVSKPLQCYACGGEHQVYVCKEFLGMSHDDRIKLASSKRLCFRCLITGHVVSRCRRNWTCRCGSDKHHNLLHPPGEVRVNTGVVSSGNKVFMRILPVIVTSSNGRQVSTLALLDDGSDTSLCSEDLMRRLGARGERLKFTSSTINGDRESEGWTFKLSVRGKYESENVSIDLLTVKNIPAPADSRPTVEELSKWDHLRSIPWENHKYDKVDMLIAVDTPQAFWVQDERKGESKDPYGIKTPLGWTIMGPGQTGGRCHFNRIQVSNQRLLDEVQKSWAVENSGLNDHEDSLEDIRAREIMSSTIRKTDGHYEMGLLWKHDEHFMPSSRSMAESRLSSLKRRLAADDNMKVKYTEVIEGYIEKGYAEPVLEDGTPGNVWYLPHHPVVHPHKDKVRVVYDCAAKYGGTSLNDQLLKGPDLMNDLLGVLLRFRQGKVAVVADIEAMFHQVKMRESDRDVLRFLWWKNGDMGKLPKEYRMCVHLFGATSSPCCSGKALKQTADDNEAANQDDVGKKAIETIRTGFYVDDCLSSVKNTDAAVRLVHRLKEILSESGFKLTKWLSNERKVIESVPEAERAPSVSLSLDELPTERTLGVCWSAESDIFTFQPTPKVKSMTRRGLLSVTSSIFDPLGFASPFVLIARSLLQDVCRRGADWDQPLTDEEQQKWRTWLDHISLLSQVSVPRWLRLDVAVGVQLHIFCDASEMGYAAVAYLRVEHDDGQVRIEFILGKARVSPLKLVTIPRLELMAAVLAATINGTIRKEIGYSLPETTYWSDSMIVLSYIGNETKRYKTFVANRVSKILSVSSKHQWRHVPSEQNPADDGSRGTYDLSEWLTGPDFFSEEETSWPVSNLCYDSTSSTPDPEVKKTAVVAQTTLRQSKTDDTLTATLAGKYSSWTKLRRVMGWVLRFVRNLRAKAKHQPVTTGNLLVSELNDSEMMTLSSDQRRTFACWQTDKRLKSLSPVLMGKLLRVGGRLDRARIDYDMQHPIILSPDGSVVKALVLSYHEKVGHSGWKATLNALRERYWILRGTSVVKGLLRNCVTCKKYNARPAEQVMASLPEERVTADHPPFTFTGVDYFGPIEVKQGRSAVKRYGCIFTCLTSRAVHLEVADTLNADSFLNAYRRFAARRGEPSKMFSDNGRNFTAGEKELRQALAQMNQDTVEDFLHTKGVEWHFNPPSASHFGGVWERLIRSVRKTLHGVLKEQRLNDDVLHTLLVEVENILNSRPLTDLPPDAYDEEPLTPNHLLMMRKGPVAPVSNVEAYGKRRWLQVQYLASLFWTRWKREYLPLLQKRHKWTTPRANVQVNDIVLLVDEFLPRGRWTMGKVLTVYKSKDGRVRSVDVKVSSGVLKRPIAKLCIIHRDSVIAGAAC